METSINNIPDNWENRISQAAKVMGLTPQQVEEILNSPNFKIVKDPCGLEMLSDETVTPFGDLRKLFCEDNNVAVPQLRMAIKYLRGEIKKNTTESVDPDVLELQRKFGINIKFKLDDLGPEELIPLYNPNKKNYIYTALVKKYGNKPIIAFKPDSNVIAVEETVNYIVDLGDGYSDEESIEVDGELVRLYPLGVLPNQEVDEDPMYSGEPLKRNRSLVNRLNWNGISIETRQFFRILVNRKDISPDNRLEVSQLIKNKFDELKSLYPEAYLEYKELKKKGDLPKLQISITEATTKKINNPFGVGSNRNY